MNPRRPSRCGNPLVYAARVITTPLLAAAMAGCGTAAYPGAAPSSPAPVNITVRRPIAPSAVDPTRGHVPSPRLAAGHGPGPSSATTRMPATTTQADPPLSLPPARVKQPSAAPITPAVLAGVPASTSQVVVERSPTYGATSGALTAWTRFGRTAHWVRAFGPWPARLGYNGTAPPGSKREGDGRTPSGQFGFDYMFGVQPDPGVASRWRPVHNDDYWDDDPSSPHYNQWVVGRLNAGASPEPMDNPTPYAYGAVIAYNTARIPGNGSAIFLHVATGGTTAGCISLPQTNLISVLRWLQPTSNPIMSIAVGD